MECLPCLMTWTHEEPCTMLLCRSVWPQQVLQDESGKLVVSRFGQLHLEILQVTFKVAARSGAQKRCS